MRHNHATLSVATLYFDLIGFGATDRHVVIDDVRLVPDILRGVRNRLEYLRSDGIHPNAQGHAVIARTIYRHLAPILRGRILKPAWQRRLEERAREASPEQP